MEEKAASSGSRTTIIKDTTILWYGDRLHSGQAGLQGGRVEKRSDLFSSRFSLVCFYCFRVCGNGTPRLQPFSFWPRCLRSGCVNAHRKCVNLATFPSSMNRLVGRDSACSCHDSGEGWHEVEFNMLDIQERDCEKKGDGKHVLGWHSLLSSDERLVRRLLLEAIQTWD